MIISDNSKIILGKEAFEKIFSLDSNYVSKYLGLLESFGGMESKPFTISDINKTLNISNEEALKIIKILEEINLIDACNNEFVLIDYKNNKDTIILSRATLKCLLDVYNLSPQEIVVAIGLLYLIEFNNNGLININYLKEKLSMDDKIFESSIRTLENKNLIRINESFLEDELIKIVNYEIHF